MRKQRTITVNGQRIKIVSTLRTHYGNHAGYTVTINGSKYRYSCLERQRAEDLAFVKWVDANAPA